MPPGRTLFELGGFGSLKLKKFPFLYMDFARSKRVVLLTVRQRGLTMIQWEVIQDVECYKGDKEHLTDRKN
jgi:hypothetical protein